MEGKNEMKSFLKLFRSTKLAVILMILIATVAGIGTFIPQNNDQAFYISHYAGFGKLIIIFGLDHYSHSILFGALLSLFFLNMLVCALSRMIKTWPILFSKNINVSRFDYELPINFTLIKKEFKKMGFKLRKSGDIVFATRGIISKLGPDIIHVGILIAIIGGIVVGLTTTQKMFFMQPGDTRQIGTFNIKLIDFKFLTYPNGQPKNWISVVQVSNKKTTYTKNITVNNPLNLGNGRLLYQSSYDKNWDVKLKFTGLNYEYEGPAATSIKYGGYTIYISEFIPDFRISGNNQVISASDEPKNPAIYVEYQKDGKRVGRQWVFSKFDFPTDPKDFPIKVSIDGFSSHLTTGLMMVHSEGDWLIFIALTLISIGVLTTITKSYAKIVIKSHDNRTFVRVLFAKEKEEITKKITALTAEHKISK